MARVTPSFWSQTSLVVKCSLLILPWIVWVSVMCRLCNVCYSLRLVRTRLTRNFGLHSRKPLAGPESNRIDSHTLRIRITRNRLTRNFGLYNCQIFPGQRSFRFVRRKITHSTIQTDTSRAFAASSTGSTFVCIIPFLPYMVYFWNFGVFGDFEFFLLNIISVSKHIFSGSPELRPNQNWL